MSNKNKGRTKKLPLAELESIAQRTCKASLQGYLIFPEIRSNLALGIRIDGDRRTFELYIPAVKPTEARVIASIAVNVYTGETDVRIFIDRDGRDKKLQWIGTNK